MNTIRGLMAESLEVGAAVAGLIIVDSGDALARLSLPVYMRRDAKDVFTTLRMLRNAIETFARTSSDDDPTRDWAVRFLAVTGELEMMAGGMYLSGMAAEFLDRFAANGLEGGPFFDSLTELRVRAARGGTIH